MVCVFIILLLGFFVFCGVIENDGGNERGNKRVIYLLSPRSSLVMNKSNRGDGGDEMKEMKGRDEGERGEEGEEGDEGGEGGQ